MKRSHRRKVEDFMSTAVVALKESDTLAMAEEAMRLADIRHLPVVDAGNHVVGIVSQRDVLRAGARKNGSPMPIGEVMTSYVRTVRPHTPADEAAELMIDDKIGSLPVVGDDEQLVGIVTETDFLIVAREALRGTIVGRSGAGA